MEFTGKLQSVNRDFKTNKIILSFEINENVPDVINRFDSKNLSIKVAELKEKRSKDANALMWACLQEIAAALNADKWDIYLMMLRRYGKFTYICVKPNVVDAVKATWRTCEEVGHVNINGTDAVQLLCYFGSSTYNTSEFSRLLDGIISEMKELGLQQPTSQEMERALELWEKQNQY